MNETEMVKRTQAALGRAGVQDDVVAAAVFLPRGHFAGAFAGGLIGDSIGGGLAGSVATAGGAMAGMHAADAASPMPDRCVVGVSPTRVYGFGSRRAKGGREPTDIVFAVPREGLAVKVHQRFNVRVLELIDGESGAAIELEGPRMPGFHVGDVIDALRA